MCPLWVFGPNILQKKARLGRFSLHMDTWMSLAKIRKKVDKNGQFSDRINHKSGYEGKFWKLEEAEGTFLKVGLQAPIHPQVMHTTQAANHGEVYKSWKSNKDLGCINPTLDPKQKGSTSRNSPPANLQRFCFLRREALFSFQNGGPMPLFFDDP